MALHAEAVAQLGPLGLRVRRHAVEFVVGYFVPIFPWHIKISLTSTSLDEARGRGYKICYWHRLAAGSM